MTSKIFIGLVMVTYYIGAALGAYIVMVNPDKLDAYLAYIGTTSTAALGFYIWKAKAENVKKIENKLELMKEGLDSEITYGNDTY